MLQLVLLALTYHQQSQWLQAIMVGLARLLFNRLTLLN
jgi:hypothetical protein